MDDISSTPPPTLADLVARGEPGQALSAVMAAFPNAILLAHPRAARHLVAPDKLVASATAVYGEEHFRRVYGTIEPIPEGRVRTLDDGASVELGDSVLVAHHTQGHAKHHLVLHDAATGTVYTGDTFGLVYPHLQRKGTIAFASTSPTDFDAKAALASITKVVSLGERTASPTHFGDVTEVEAIRRVFGQGKTPPVASTKSLTGHCLGGAGVWEAIYSLIMMNGNFIAASANVETLDPALDPSEIVTTLRENLAIDSVLSNSFGFGGTNATLVMSKYLA